MIVKKEQAIHREVVPGVFQTHYIDKSSGAGGVSMGVVTLQPGAGLKPHTHKVEDAMIIIEGKGLFILGDREYPIEEGMAVMAPAGTPHGLRNNGDKPLRIVYTWPAVEVERYFI
ncbi:MAG: cupin domain-containing protein [Peptococcaceae bacterium]|jgi:quercetin dioxygenase-like cupin family protein|nr:cupin domain-containing protein [Peptococcaceae bacterium]MDH7526391.1 cupin domain-containing protein [Peptococcaceae bacterium]